jgi:hypothetical protein
VKEEAMNHLEPHLRHPVREARRLHALAEAGESAATPLIETALIVLLVVPLALALIAIVETVYYAVG